MNDLNGAFENLTGGTSAVDAVMAGLAGTTGLLFAAFKGLDSVMDALGLKNKDYAGAVDITGQSQALWTQGLNDTQLAALGITPAMGSATGATKEQDKAAADAAANTAKAKAATDAWIASLFKLQGQALSLSGAQIGYQASIDAATASIKANGKAHDINTEKGRANRTALDAVAKAANDQTQAMLDSGKGVRAASTSAANAQGTFVKLAEKMGYSHDQAVALARSLVAIPKKTETDLKADITDLQSKIKTAKTKLGDKDLTKARRAQIQANIADLQSKLRTAQAAINALHGKTVGVTIKYSTTGVNLTTPSSVGRREAGGPVRKGEPYIVGEKRSELFVPEQNGYIIPDPSKLGGAKGGTSAGSYAPMVAQGNVPHFTLGSDGSELGDFLMRIIRTSMQRQGGNPSLLGVS